MTEVTGRMICPQCGLGEVTEEMSTCPRCGTTFSKPRAPDAVPEAILLSVRKELGSDYQIERTLGSGGMSIVFLARERELNRKVALKVLPLQLTMGPDAPERFKREAKMAASLDHPNIVPVHRVGTTPMFLWYSMKYVKGRSLGDILKDTGPMNVSDCLAIIEQVARALDYAHRRGIVHRDIKPANILIDETGWVSVCDFGIARAFGALPLTQTGATLGTPAYMSTEQCYGRTVDGHSDQYSLAIVTYECLSGGPPFQADSLGEIVRMHCLEPPPNISKARPDIDEALADALLRAMSKQPGERFESVGEFVEALGGEPGRPAPAALSAEVPVASLSTAPTKPVTIQTSAVRRWWPIAALAIAVVAAFVWITALTRPPPHTMPPATPATAVSAELGMLSVNSNPWGNVYINDRFVGTTPQRNIELEPGSYRLRIVRDGFEPHEQAVEIASGEELRLTDIVLREASQ